MNARAAKPTEIEPSCCKLTHPLVCSEPVDTALTITSMWPLAGNARGQWPEGEQRDPPAHWTAGLESLLPQAIIVRLDLAAEPSIERAGLFPKLRVRPSEPARSLGAASFRGS